VAIMGASEAVEELRATHDREGPHGEEKRRPARDPSCAVGAEGTARHDTVEVDVLGERLAPGVEDGRDADGPTEVAGVAPEGQKGVGHGAKQEVVDDARIPLGERIERVREREDDVKVRDREQLGPARREPAVAGNRLTRRAVAIATRVVRDPRRAAAITRVAVAAQHGRAARGDRPEGHLLDLGQAMGPRERLSTHAHDLCQRHPWAGVRRCDAHGSRLDRRLPGRRGGNVQEIQW